MFIHDIMYVKYVRYDKLFRMTSDRMIFKNGTLNHNVARGKMTLTLID